MHISVWKYITHTIYLLHVSNILEYIYLQLLILISHPAAQCTVTVHWRNMYLLLMANKYLTKMAVIPTK
jgi:hypothetical protein